MLNSLVVSTNQTKGKMVQVLLEPKTKLQDSLTYDVTAWSALCLWIEGNGNEIQLKQFLIGKQNLSQSYFLNLLMATHWTITALMTANFLPLYSRPMAAFDLMKLLCVIIKIGTVEAFFFSEQTIK